MSIKDIFFPMAKSLEALEQLDDMERIKRNNYELAERLKEQERMERDYPFKTYHLEVISGGKILPYTIEARGHEYSESGCYYFYNYTMSDNYNRIRETLAYFPIDKTIIKKIEII